MFHCLLNGLLCDSLRNFTFFCFINSASNEFLHHPIKYATLRFKTRTETRQNLSFTPINSIDFLHIPEDVVADLFSGYFLFSVIVRILLGRMVTRWGVYKLLVFGLLNGAFMSFLMFFRIPVTDRGGTCREGGVSRRSTDAKQAAA